MSQIEYIGFVVFVLGVGGAIISRRHQAWVVAYGVVALIGLLPFVINAGGSLATTFTGA